MREYLSWGFWCKYVRGAAPLALLLLLVIRRRVATLYLNQMTLIQAIALWQEEARRISLHVRSLCKQAIGGLWIVGIGNE